MCNNYIKYNKKELEEIIYCLENFAIYHAKGDLPYSKRTLNALQKACKILDCIKKDID